MIKSIKLKPKDERERKILKAMEARYKMSRQDMQKQHEKWRKAEEQALAYMPERDVDAMRRASREGGKPQYTTIVIPYSYAILMAAHTYWTSVFLARDPIMQFKARHGETHGNVQAVEALMDYQVQVGGQLVPYYIWLLDTGKYGIGILGNYWEEEKTHVPEIEEYEEMFLGTIPTGRMKKRKVTKVIDGYHGNKVYNVRPYDWFPDTRLPLNRFQEGEFCAVNCSLGWNEIQRRVSTGQYIEEKVKQLKNRKRERDGDNYQYGTDQYEMPNTESSILTDTDVADVGFNDLLEMTIELIPSQWGLGDGDYPEKWHFTSTRDFKLIIEARPLGVYHNKYPFAINELEPEGYALFKRGMMEIVEPLQYTMDWLFNSHFYNVRKVINDQFIVDPSKVVMKDVLNPGAGKIIRLRPSAYGSDVRTAMTQMGVVDVTQQHLKDTQVIGEMMQRASGVVDNIMGLVNQGGRKTATEVRTSSSFSANRLKTQAEYFSAMGWSQNSQMMLQNTQQFYELERKYRIAGDLLDQRDATTITPDMIQGFYDFVPVDGTLPIDRFAQANLWSRLLQEGQKMPQVMAQYDLGKIFAWVAQLSGLKNINQFKIQIAEDGEIGSGNIPIGGGNGAGVASPGGTDIRNPEDIERLGGTTRLEGMGATG